MTAPLPPPEAVLQHLRVERRSFILGTLIIWAVVMAAELFLAASMYPGIFTATPGETVHQQIQRVSQLPPPSAHEELILQAVLLVGGLALFFLNWRFSLLIRRPRRAFPAAAPGGSQAARWLWWVVLALNSLFYQLFFPQLAITWLLARWGTDEIRRREAELLRPRAQNP